MKFIVRFSFAFSVILLRVSVATGQLSDWNNSPDVSQHVDGFNFANAARKELIPGFRGDRQSNYKLAVPVLSLPPNSFSFSSESYWMGTITTQSYNRGKIGRYYYWDMLGNLQGSHLFLDVAGKGKRGLKLVFPRQRMSF